MRPLLRHALVLVTLGVLCAPLLCAAAEEVWVPAPEGQKNQKVKLRVERYVGGTNGELTVEISNPGATPTEFDAQGLYFLPAGNPDDAPQRLGAVGPFQVLSQHGDARQTRLILPAAGKAKLRLDVYCIDSHRRSPRTGDLFKLATQRMPKELTREISREADTAANRAGGYAAPAAKSSVQSEVWKARDRKWLKLQGEGRQEATK